MKCLYCEDFNFNLKSLGFLIVENFVSYTGLYLHIDYYSSISMISRYRYKILVNAIRTISQLQSRMVPLTSKQFKFNLNIDSYLNPTPNKCFVENSIWMLLHAERHKKLFFSETKQVLFNLFLKKLWYNTNFVGAYF